MSLKLANLAAYYLGELGEYDSASQYLDSMLIEFKVPVAPEEFELFISIYQRRGYFHEELNDYYQAYIDYQKAIQLVSQLCDSSSYWNCYDTRFIGNFVLHNLGNLYREIGDFKSILSEIPEKFLTEFRDVYDRKNGSELAKLLVNKGIAYLNLDEYDKAYSLFQESRDIPNLDLEMEALIQINLSLLHRKRKKKDWFSKSLNALDSAEVFVSQILEKDRSGGLDMLARIGWYRAYAHYYKGDFESALDIIHSSIKLLEPTYKNQNHSIYADPFMLIAKLNDSLGNYSAAIDFYYKVIQMFCPSIKKDDSYHLPLPNELRAERNLSEALIGAANYFSRKAVETNDHKFAQKALNAHRLAIQVEDQMRVLYPHESTRLKMNAERTERIAKALNIAFNLGGESPSDSEVKEILFLMEKSKFLELSYLLEIQKQSYELDKGVLEKERAFRMTHFAWAEAENRLRMLENSQAPNPLEGDKLIQLVQKKEMQKNLAWADLQTTLAENFGDFWGSKYRLDSISIPPIRKYLAQKETFVSFFNSKNFLYALYLSPNHATFKKIAIDEELQTNLDSVNKLLRISTLLPRQKILYQKVAFDLYRELLRPIKNWDCSRLIVATCPLLYNLPLECLLTKINPSEQTSSYTNWAYLWKTYEICYTFSSVLYTESKLVTRDPKFDYVGFAPDYGIDNFILSQRSLEGGVKELTYNSFEVWKADSINKIYGANSKVFYSYDASIDSFRQNAQDAKVLHLAMHAFGSYEGSEDPYLLFCPDSGVIITQKNIQNYSFPVSEVPTMRYGADLLIMSACNSGLGRIVSGEGIMNFGRAFRLAGIPNTVMSLWEVDDYSPSEIMPYFISYLQQGMPKTQALNEARRAYLESQDEGNSFASPFYWAHFVLVGNPDPIYKKQTDSIWSIAEQYIEYFYLNNKHLFWGSFLIVLAFVLYILYLSFSQLTRYRY
ncbi:MAG: CHAT domain-containing tetratricopeptide repeat protein [Bacteroidota bacterium]